MFTGFWCSLEGGIDATRIASDPSICLVDLTLFTIMDIDALGNQTIPNYNNVNCLRWLIEIQNF